MSKTIRVQWEYPDFADSLGNENYEDFEVDDDTSEKEIDKMAKEIKKCNDPWIEKHPTVGIIAWNGKNKFQVIKHCKINYSLAQNDWTTLAKGMISSLSKEMKKLLEGA